MLAKPVCIIAPNQQVGEDSIKANEKTNSSKMVKGDILGSHNAGDKRGLTLDFKQPKRICKMHDHQQKQQFADSGNSPDWASSLALTTPELDDKVSQFASQLDLFEVLPTPTTTSMLLPSPGTSVNASHYSRANSHHNHDHLIDANNRTINFSSASLTPTSDIERHLQQIQSLQTPLFEPIRDILASGQQSAATSPTASQQASNTNNNITTLSNYNLSSRGDTITTCNNDEDNNQRDDLNTHNNKDNSNNSTYNHSNANQRDITTTTTNHRHANQRDGHNCIKTGVLLPTPLFELDEAETNTAKDAEKQRQQQRGRNSDTQQQQQQSFSDTTAPAKQHDVIIRRQQEAELKVNNNSENDMQNINIPLSVRRISDQSCSSSMDSSYSPKFVPLTNSTGQMSNNNRQQQQPYLLLATDGNVFSSSSPDQINSMIDSQDKMKIERKRERNRLAASKCRQRKVDRITELEERVAQLEEQLRSRDYELEVHKKAGCHLGGSGAQLMQ